MGGTEIVRPREESKYGAAVVTKYTKVDPGAMQIDAIGKGKGKGEDKGNDGKTKDAAAKAKANAKDQPATGAEDKQHCPISWVRHLPKPCGYAQDIQSDKGKTEQTQRRQRQIGKKQRWKSGIAVRTNVHRR